MSNRVNSASNLPIRERLAKAMAVPTKSTAGTLKWPD